MRIEKKLIILVMCSLLLHSCNNNGEIDQDVISKDSKGRIYKKMHIFRNYSITYDPPIPEFITITLYDTLGRETERHSMSRYNPDAAWDLDKLIVRRNLNCDSIYYTYKLGIRKDSTDWSVLRNTQKSIIVYKFHEGDFKIPFYTKTWPAHDSIGPDSSKAQEYIWVDSLRRTIAKLVSDTSLKYQ